MTQYLTILQFGPVQEFIRMARRTDDYWAGSFLLSLSTAQILNLLQELATTNIIFPSANSNEMMAAVKTGNFTNPKALFPSLPNRVAALVEANDPTELKAKLETIKTKVLQSLQKQFETTENNLTGQKNFSSDQIRDLFEFFFAFVEYDPGNHASSLAKVEKHMAARKNIRDFKSFDQQGFKCTQCGVREPLRGTNSPSDLQALKTYWKNLRHNKYQYRFKENERLCAVCAGKRLLRSSSYSGGIPSTSTVTLAAWVDAIIGYLESNSPLVTNFIFGLNKADLNQIMTPVPKNDQNPHPLFKVEGDCFIADSYSRFEKEAETADGITTVKEAKRNLTELLGQLPHDLKNPPKYYAIIAFDGDSIGTHLRTLKSLGAHQEFSQQLADFTNSVYQKIHNDFHGYVIYYGGDEGIILMPLSEMFDAMESLRIGFEAKTGRTMSAGAAVIHHQAPLGQGLMAAEDALGRAKGIDDKNAFAITIHKRSGSQMFCVSPWEVSNNAGGSSKVIDYLKTWQVSYETDHLSPKWYHTLSAASHLLRTEDGRYDQDMAVNQMHRTLPRHFPPGNAAKAQALINQTKDVLYGHNELMNTDNLLALLYTPLYISQGGQD